MNPNSGATVASTGLRDQIFAWASHHQRLFGLTLQETMRSPFNTLMTWLVIGIALGLPLIFYVVLQNLSSVSDDWGSEPKLAIFLNQEVTLFEGKAFAQDITQREDVQKTVFVSSSQALREFQERSGFGDVLSTLDRNPLPHVIEVVPLSSDPLQLNKLLGIWTSNPLIDKVVVDFQWLERLSPLLLLAERSVSALAILFGLGVMLVMGNTIRLAIESRRQEIEIIKLVGGSDAFVRRPFLYLGFWYGLGGAITALVLTQLSLYFLSSPVELLAQSYREDFALEGLSFMENFSLIIAGSVLGIVGSGFSVLRHLADIAPD